MDGDQVLSRGSARSGYPLYTSMTLEKPEKDGYLFLGWMGPDGEYVDEASVFVRDTVLRADFLKDEDATRPDYLFFKPCDMWVDVNNGGDEFSVVFLPADAQDKRIQWESSDVSVAEAEVDEYFAYSIVARKAGDAVITGTMRSGLQRSLAVHVYDSTVSPVGTLTSIAPERDSLTLNVGESGQVLMTLTPGNSRPMLILIST